MNEIQINNNSLRGPYGNFKKKKKGSKPLLCGHENKSWFSQYKVSAPTDSEASPCLVGGRVLPVSFPEARRV